MEAVALRRPGVSSGLPVQRDFCRMWIFVGASLVYILYPIIEEWRQRRLDEKRLASMRRHAALGHHWDPARGRWADDQNPPLRGALAVCDCPRHAVAKH
jgi:hypothetical protein